MDNLTITEYLAYCGGSDHLICDRETARKIVGQHLNNPRIHHRFTDDGVTLSLRVRWRSGRA